METALESQNYIRLGQLLLEGHQIFCHLFQSRYKLLTGQEWEHNLSCGKNFMKTFGKKQYAKVGPLEKKILNSGKLNEWNLTYITNFLVNINYGGSPEEKIEMAKDNVEIKKFAQVHNRYAQITDKGVNRELFCQLFVDSIAVLVNLRGRHHDLFDHVNSLSSTTSLSDKINPDSTTTTYMEQLSKGGEDNNQDLIEINQHYLNSTDRSLRTRAALFFSQKLVKLAQQDEDEEKYRAAAEFLNKESAEENPINLYNLGMHYLLGKGVEKDEGRAIDLFKIAANQPSFQLSEGKVRNFGVAESQFALASIYQLGNRVAQDYDEAIKWFEKCIESDNGYGPAPKILVNLRRTPNTPTASSRVNTEQVPSVVDAPSPVSKENKVWPYLYQDFILNYENPIPYRDLTNTKRFWSCEQQLRLQASQDGFGFTGQIRDAMDYLSRAQQALVFLLGHPIENKEEDLRVKAEIIHLFANALKIKEDIADQSLWEKVGPIIHEMMIYIKTTNPEESSCLDRDTRLCHSILLKGCKTARRPYDLGDLIEFVQESILKYPKEVFFYRHLIVIHNINGNIFGALGEANVAATRFHEDDRVLYLRATMLQLAHLQDRQYKLEIQKALIRFIKVVPTDHYLIPDVYYRLAVLIAPDGPLHLALNYYDKGLAAENKLLPCFLPYYSQPKEAFEDFMIESDKHQQREVKEEVKDFIVQEEVKSTPMRQDLSSKLTSHQRVRAVLNLRQELNRCGIPMARIGHRVIPMEEQEKHEPVSLDNLTPITFAELDWSCDRIYKGRVIKLTIVEDSCFGIAFIYTVVRDGNGDDSLCYFWTDERNEDLWEQERCKGKDWLKNFSFGSIISIANPKVCVPKREGGRFGVSVKGINNIIFHSVGSEGNIKCRFCFDEPNPPRTCTSCKRAKYCGRKCQKADWNLLNHKLICDPNYPDL